MPESFPLALTLLGLFAVAFVRGQATYWLARVISTQASRHSPAADRDGWRAGVRRWLESPHVARGRDAVQRHGLPAISLCYLTIGVQTVVLAAAGLLRIGWLRFTVAQLPGALAWAVIYATIGMAAWTALVDRALTSRPFLIALATLLTAGALAWALRRHHQRESRRRESDLEDAVR